MYPIVTLFRPLHNTWPQATLVAGIKGRWDK